MIFLSGIAYNLFLRGVSLGYFPFFIHEQRVVIKILWDEN